LTYVLAVTSVPNASESAASVLAALLPKAVDNASCTPVRLGRKYSTLFRNFPAACPVYMNQQTQLCYSSLVNRPSAGVQIRKQNQACKIVHPGVQNR
jgi:hypothetical protein